MKWRGMFWTNRIFLNVSCFFLNRWFVAFVTFSPSTNGELRIACLCTVQGVITFFLDKHARPLGISQRCIEKIQQLQTIGLTKLRHCYSPFLLLINMLTTSSGYFFEKILNWRWDENSLFYIYLHNHKYQIDTSYHSSFLYLNGVPCILHQIRIFKFNQMSFCKLTLLWRI